VMGGQNEGILRNVCNNEGDLGPSNSEVRDPRRGQRGLVGGTEKEVPTKKEKRKTPQEKLRKIRQKTNPKLTSDESKPVQKFRDKKVRSSKGKGGP